MNRFQILHFGPSALQISFARNFKVLLNSEVYARIALNFANYRLSTSKQSTTSYSTRENKSNLK